MKNVEFGYSPGMEDMIFAGFVQGNMSQQDFSPEKMAAFYDLMTEVKGCADVEEIAKTIPEAKFGPMFIATIILREKFQTPEEDIRAWLKDGTIVQKAANKILENTSFDSLFGSMNSFSTNQKPNKKQKRWQH